MGLLCGENIDECTASAESPCQNGALCMDTPGSYKCQCLPGYRPPHCQQVGECVCVWGGGRVCGGGGEREIIDGGGV